MEKYWNRLKFGYVDSDSTPMITGDKFWDLIYEYLHTGILEVSRRNYQKDHPEIELFVDIILQSGKDLHDTNAYIKADAQSYINSITFEEDCALLGLNDEIIKMLLLKSVENRDRIVSALNGDIENA